MMVYASGSLQFHVERISMRLSYIEWYRNNFLLDPIGGVA